MTCDVDDHLDRAFVHSHTFNAGASTLYQAVTDPGVVRRWWGPKRWDVPHCEMDVREGGRYRIVQRDPEGVEYPLKGSYLEVEPDVALSMLFDCSEHPAVWHDFVSPGRDRARPPSFTAVFEFTFEEAEGRSRLTIHGRFRSDADRIGMFNMGLAEGWRQSLERLGDVLSAGEP